MAHSLDQKDRVRNDFVFARRSLKDAAKRGGVPLSTARNWKRSARNNGDDWEAARKNAALAGLPHDLLIEKLVSDYIPFHTQVLEALKVNEKDLSPEKQAAALASLASTFDKMMGAASKGSPKLSELAVATTTLQRFGDFLLQKDVEAASIFVKYITEFGQELEVSHG
ncbi:MAG: DUF1804 family protein [Magnetococcales bacterium]|nr:DUF1804 family protein [Magnetococcales bacterium]